MGPELSFEASRSSGQKTAGKRIPKLVVPGQNIMRLSLLDFISTIFENLFSESLFQLLGRNSRMKIFGDLKPNELHRRKWGKKSNPALTRQAMICGLRWLFFNSKTKNFKYTLHKVSKCGFLTSVFDQIRTTDSISDVLFLQFR